MKKFFTATMFVLAGCFCLVSCLNEEIELDMEVELDLSGYKSIPDGGSVNVQGEAKCLLEVGSEITIVVPKDLNSDALKWVSDNPTVASVELDKITALKAGKAKITDANGSAKVISIIVREKK